MKAQSALPIAQTPVPARTTWNACSIRPHIQIWNSRIWRIKNSLPAVIKAVTEKKSSKPIISPQITRISRLKLSSRKIGKRICPGFLSGRTKLVLPWTKTRSFRSQINCHRWSQGNIMCLTSMMTLSRSRLRRWSQMKMCMISRNLLIFRELSLNSLFETNLRSNLEKILLIKTLAARKSGQSWMKSM